MMGETDIMKTIQLLPGIQSGSEGTSGLYVRGGGPDQNLILLDGVPVYNASHLFGFFSVFNISDLVGLDEKAQTKLNKIIESFSIGNWDSDKISLYLPYINFDKKEILKDALTSTDFLNLDFNSIFKNTITSYAPDKNGISNGKTGSDIERILAFNAIFTLSLRSFFVCEIVLPFTNLFPSI